MATTPQYTSSLHRQASPSPSVPDSSMPLFSVLARPTYSDQPTSHPTFRLRSFLANTDYPCPLHPPADNSCLVYACRHRLLIPVPLAPSLPDKPGLVMSFPNTADPSIQFSPYPSRLLYSLHVLPDFSRRLYVSSDNPRLVSSCRSRSHPTSQIGSNLFFSPTDPSFPTSHAGSYQAVTDFSSHLASFQSRSDFSSRDSSCLITSRHLRRNYAHLLSFTPTDLA